MLTCCIVQSTWNTGSATPYQSAFSGSRTPAAWDAGGRTPAYGGGGGAPTPGVYGSAPTPGAYGAPTPGGGGDEGDGYE